MNEIIKQSDEIKNMIYVIREKEVMLDSDLAKLYGCKNGTKDINKAVKRNIGRFPKNFYFQLTKTEYYNILRFQNGTLELNQGQYSKYLPFVFTEAGVAMLSSVLRTENAVSISIKIIEAFIAMRHFVYENEHILENLININNELMENKQHLLIHDKKLNELFSKFETKVFANKIYFSGEIYDAYSKLMDIMNEAKKELIIIDNYADKSVLDMISKLIVKVVLIIKTNPLLKDIDIKKYN